MCPETEQFCGSHVVFNTLVYLMFELKAADLMSERRVNGSEGIDRRRKSEGRVSVAAT